MLLRHSSGSSGQRGFTLVELLVVIAIIALLISITAGGIFAVVEGQKKSNTEQTLTVLASTLRQQWQAVVETAGKEAVDPNVQTMAGGDYNRARVIWISLRLKQEFPQGFSEALNPTLVSPSGQTILPALYLTQLAQMGITQANAQPLDYEASVCLLLALKRMRKGVALKEDLLGSGVLQSRSYQDPVNGSINVRLLVDAWGTPLGFYRFPAGCQELQSMAPQLTTAPNSAIRNPLDPQGLLINPNWWGGAQTKQFRQFFEQVCYTESNAAGTGPQSYYIVPVIASAGRSGGNVVQPFVTAVQRFGVDPFMTIIDPNQESNNFYSFRLRLGARGD